jgi:phosphate transport system permease protein
MKPAIATRPALHAPQGRYLKERLIQGVLFSCAFLAVVVTAVTIWIFISGSGIFFAKVPLGEFLGGTRWAPTDISTPSYGALPLIVGTLIITGIALLVAVPIGLLSAIYLSEFASERVRKVAKPILEILAGIPTVVYGYFALLFITPLLRSVLPEIQFWNALSAGIALGIAIIPLVSSLSEDIIYAVPRALREGAYALGATKYETIRSVVLPAALSGIAAATILAMSRAIGETMIVAIAAGRVPTWPPDLLKPLETLTVHIVNVATGDAEAGAFIWATIFAIGALLFVMTLLLNILSYWIVRRFREQYE